MHSILATSRSVRAAAPLASSSSNTRRANSSSNKLRIAIRAKPAAGEEHFEPAEPRGECLLEDAR